jgi:C-terminal processing protease CtpA/Prc
MAHFKWRAAALVALTSLALTTYVVAQQPAGGGQGSGGSSQSASSSGSNQRQSQASNSNENKNTSSAQRDNAPDSRDAKSSQDQSKQDQRSSSRSREREDHDANYDRDRDRDNRDDRSSARERSSRDEDRNAESRPTSDRDSARDSSRERSSRRGNMRGPDIGLWFNRSTRDGLVISDVSTKGAIAKFGFREGDRIVSVDGRRVTREDEFIDFLLHSNARRVKVIVLRDNREEIIYVEPAVLLEEEEYMEVDPLVRFGIVLDDRYDDRIVVWRVIPRSPAYYAGFRAGDVIVTFSGRPYRTRTEFERGARDWKTGETNVQVRRGDRTRDLSVDVPTFDRAEHRSERTAQRESTTSDQRGSDQGIIDQSNRPATDQGNAPRRGILGRGRGNR